MYDLKLYIVVVACESYESLMTTKLVRNVYGLSLEHSLVDNFNIIFWEILTDV